MAQKYYEVTVEAMVQRTVMIKAENIVNAEIEARGEVKSLVGATSTQVVSAYRCRRDGTPVVNLTLNEMKREQV